MSAPLAEYELTACPEWLPVSVPLGGRVVLDPARPLYVSRRAEDAICVSPPDDRLFALGWGGVRNHLVDFSDRGWRVHYLHHHADLMLNGALWRGPAHALAHGDRVQPARGLVFTFFFRDDLEPLADELATRPGVASADQRVLMDWVLERLGCSEDDAARTCSHLRCRLAHASSPANGRS